MSLPRAIQILKYMYTTFHKLITESVYKYNYAPNSNYNFLSTSLADLDLLHCSPQPWWLTLRFDLHGCQEPAMEVGLYSCWEPGGPTPTSMVAKELDQSHKGPWPWRRYLHGQSGPGRRSNLQGGHGHHWWVTPTQLQRPFFLVLFLFIFFLVFSFRILTV